MFRKPARQQPISRDRPATIAGKHRRHRACFRESRLILAGMLSAALPGSGQFYVGRRGDAWLAFILNGLFVAGIVEALNEGRPEVAGVLGLFEAGWYAGNIYGAINGARKHNLHRARRFIQEMEDQFPYEPPGSSPSGPTPGYPVRPGILRDGRPIPSIPEARYRPGAGLSSMILGVPPRPLSITRPQLVEYLFHHRTASDSLERQAPGMQVTTLAPRNNPVHQATYFLGLHFGGTNTLVCKNRYRQVRKQSLPMTCAAVQTFSFFQMAHNQHTFLAWRFIRFFLANPRPRDPCQGPTPYWSRSPLFR